MAEPAELPDELPEEEWRIVARYPTYEVSNRGRFRNALTLHVKPSYTQKRGAYLYVSLYCRVRHKSISTRTTPLIATAFLPPRPSPQHQCDHQDGDKTNELISNLRWLTGQENVQAHTDSPRRAKTHLFKRWLTQQEYDEIHRLHKEGWNQVQIGIKLDVGNFHVCRILAGRTKPRVFNCPQIQPSKPSLSEKLVTRLEELSYHQAHNPGWGYRRLAQV